MTEQRPFREQLGNVIYVNGHYDDEDGWNNAFWSARVADLQDELKHGVVVPVLMLHQIEVWRMWRDGVL